MIELEGYFNSDFFKKLQTELPKQGKLSNGDQAILAADTSALIFQRDTNGINAFLGGLTCLLGESKPAIQSRGFIKGITNILERTSADPRFYQPLPTLPRIEKPEKARKIKELGRSIRTSSREGQPLSAEAFDTLVGYVADMVFDEDHEANEEIGGLSRWNYRFTPDEEGQGKLLSTALFSNRASGTLPPRIIRRSDSSKSLPEQKGLINVTTIPSDYPNEITIYDLTELHYITIAASNNQQEGLRIKIDDLPRDEDGPYYPEEIASLQQNGLLLVKQIEDYVIYEPTRRGKWVVDRSKKPNHN